MYETAMLEAIFGGPSGVDSRQQGKMCLNDSAMGVGGDDATHPGKRKDTAESQPPHRYDVWHEDHTLFRHVLRLDADTYQSDPLFHVSPVRPENVFFGEAEISPKCTFAYQNRIVPKGHPLKLLGKQQGVVVWNGDVTIPTLIDLKRQSGTGEYFSASTPLEERIHTGAVWMSLTPMEMMTQQSAVKMACFTVVIGGLGLGWLLRKVCAKPEVERVIVVEKSQELLDWYGYKMCAQFGKVRNVICDDIYRQLGKHGIDARYLLDIWHLYAGAANDYRLIPYRHSLKRRLWAWGLN